MKEAEHTDVLRDAKHLSAFVVPTDKTPGLLMTGREQCVTLHKVSTGLWTGEGRVIELWTVRGLPQYRLCKTK